MNEIQTEKGVQYRLEEEISIRELIEIFLKGKKTIAAVTILAVLIAGIVNFFVLEDVYEAKAIMMASGINERAQANDVQGVESLLDSISPYPQMTTEAYKEQIKTPQILDEVIAELELNSQDISRVGLRNMIELETVDKTNLISINVKHKDSGLAAQIANTVAKRFTAYISDISKDRAEKSSNYLKTQMEVEKENLDAALLEYKEYLSQPKGLAEVEKEVSSKIDLITQYKGDLINAEVEEEMLAASLTTARAELTKTQEKIVLEKSILDDPLMSEYVNEQANTDGSLFDINLKTEEVNESYTYLKNQVNDLEIELSRVRTQKHALNKAIATTSKELETLQGDLAEKKHLDKTISQKVNFAETTYEAFLNKYEETRILQSSDIGDASITIVSPAVETLTPVGPRKMLNVAIAGMLGLMASVGYVFFRAYWETSGQAGNVGNGTMASNVIVEE
jgi:succinoglycan biosynthesis transport protein ExoP